MKKSNLAILALMVALVTSCSNSKDGGSGVVELINTADYSLALSEPRIQMKQGDFFALQINIEGAVENLDVDLEISGLPNGLTGAFSGMNSDSMRRLDLAADGNAEPGSHSVIVTGSTGDKKAQARLVIEVSSEPFTLSIDNTIVEPLDMLTGESLAVVEDANGWQSVFILDQVLYSPTDNTALEDFLSTYSAVIVDSDVVPIPPEGSGITMDPEYLEATQYTLSLGDANFSLDTAERDGRSAGLTGAARVSSQKGAELLALIIRESSLGKNISPNFVGSVNSTSGLMNSTQEHPTTGAGFDDAFNYSYFGITGAKTNVLKAFQYIDQNPPARKARVAIIDGGFWLDPAGNPMSAIGPDSDFPATPLQYDFVSDDYIADGINLASCSGGSTCNYHGNNTASTAVGKINNQYGGAGTGGSLAEPMLFKTNLNWGQVSRAIRTAVAWGTDVISMSFGMECDNVFCDGYFDGNLYPALRNARDNGVVMVAAAGNAEQNTHSVPCKANEDVICVGALADNANTAIWYSNFGPYVDIWAPTNIIVQPNGDTTPSLASSGGTSTSAPFVAGIAAMIKAYQPTLTSRDVNNILRSTAWRDSSDRKVTHYVNAWSALLEGLLSLDAINTPPVISIENAGGVVIPEAGITVPFNRDITLIMRADDFESGFPCALCVSSMTWAPAPDFGGTQTATYRFDTPGEYRVTAQAQDREGLVGSHTALIIARNSLPVGYIEMPTSGTEVPLGASLRLVGFGLDDNEGPGPEAGRIDQVCVWTSSYSGDTDFPITGCDVNASFDSIIGERNVFLNVTDPQGSESLRVSASVVVVAPPANPGPGANINITPHNYLDNADYYIGNQVIVAFGSASSDPDTPFTYQWTATSLVGNTNSEYAGPVVIGTTQNLNWVPHDTAGLFDMGTSCYTGQRARIQLRVTDSLGNTGIAATKLVRIYCFFG